MKDTEFLTKCRGNHGNLALGSRRLSNGIVDGNLLQHRPNLFQGDLASGLILPHVGDVHQALVQRGAVLLHQLHEERGLGDEHTRIPAVLTSSEVLGSSVCIRLLLEGAYEARVGSRLEVEAVAQSNVTKASGRVRRRDTDCDEVALLCDLDSLGDGTQECILAGNHMIGSERSNDSVGVALDEDCGSQTDGGHGILGAGLSEEVGGGQVGQLAQDALGVGRSGDNSHSRRASQREESIPSRLQQTVAAEVDIEEELGVVLSRKGPETGTSTACGDDDVEAGDLAVIGVRE